MISILLETAFWQISIHIQSLVKTLWRSDKPFKAIEKHRYGLRQTVSKHLNYNTRFDTAYRVFSLMWPASMQIYWNKRKRLHKKRVQLPQDWFGTPTWPPFHCFGTPIWPPWRHVKTLYYVIFKKLYDSEALGGGRKGGTNTACALQLEIFIL